MVVSVKQMYAGDGYAYLLRTTADVQGGVLAVSHMTAYYTEQGTPPGQWLGSGIDGLAGDMAVGDAVTVEQMDALYKLGVDPATGEKLGQGFKRQASLEKRIARRVNLIPKRVTGDAREELVAKIREEESSRKVSKAVSGFDFTFSPVKSVSALWAVADCGVREQIYEAHRAALADVIDTMERRVVMTRIGANGAAQIETRGLIAAAFDHWDARGGDPLLHTHVAISNRVQGVDGRWRTLDSRGAVLPSVVAMSELYNGRIQDHLTRRLGVDWAERAGRSGSKGRWFEIKGVPKSLIEAFSSRSKDLHEETDRLVATYRQTHGRTPNKKQLFKLQVQAQRSTRPDKKIVSLATLQERWRSRAEAMGIQPDKLVRKLLSKSKPVQLLRFDDIAGSEELANALELAWSELAANFSVWKTTNAQAAVLRATQHLRMTTNDDRLQLMDHLVEQIRLRSVSVDARHSLHVPTALLRSDGSSVFQQVNSEMFTSKHLLAAEDRLVSRSRLHSGPLVDISIANQWGSQPTASGRTLTDDQAQAMEHIAISGRPVDVLVGPAGAGKTTMLSQLRGMWEETYGKGAVKGLAPSAAAAAVLGEELGIDTDNTAKWLYVQTHQKPEWLARRSALEQELSDSRDRTQRVRLATQIAAINKDLERWSLKKGDLLIVDESSLAGTLALDSLATQATESGAKLLLVGDWAQLASVEAGGAFGMLVRDREGTAPELDSIHRFKNDWEKAASIALRTGDETVLATYQKHDRIHEGTSEQTVNDAYSAWRDDIAAGKTSMMIGADNETVSTLNRRARTDRIADGLVDAGGVQLHDQTLASRGDIIVTRENRRDFATSTSAWVKNGDRWIVDTHNRDGSLLVRRAADGNQPGGPIICLPADYVATSVELAYATTAHRAQGATVDTAHAIVTPRLSREVLYVAMTRGRESNNIYVSLPDPSEAHEAHTHDEVTGLEVLAGVLAHSSAAKSATETLRDSKSHATHLARLLDEYETIAQVATTAHWDSLTRTALPGLPGTITNSPAWPQWVSTMRHIQAHGFEPTEVIETLGTGLVATDDPLGELQSRAAVLANRLDGQAIRVPGQRFAGIITTESSSNPDLDRGLRERQSFIEKQVRSATHAARHENPPWLRRIGARPMNIEAAHRWDAAVEAIVAYRLLYDITDSERPLGNGQVAHWRQARHQRRATWAIDSFRRQDDHGNSQPHVSDVHGLKL